MNFILSCTSCGETFVKISNKFILCDHDVNSHNHSLIDITYILLDVMLCIVVSLHYFSSSAVSYIPTTSKNIQRYYTTTTSNKRFIIQHAKLLRLCGRVSPIFIYRECVSEVCEAARTWHGKSAIN